MDIVVQNCHYSAKEAEAGLPQIKARLGFNATQSYSVRICLPPTESKQYMAIKCLQNKIKQDYVFRKILI